MTAITPSTQNHGNVASPLPVNTPVQPQTVTFSISTLGPAGTPVETTKGFCEWIHDAWESIIDYFRSLLSRLGLTSTQVVLSAEERENRIPNNRLAISSALDAEMARAATQMNEEPVKAFRYVPAPAGWTSHEERVGNLQVGIAHAQGRRPTMEDEHLAVSFNIALRGRNYPVQLFGIFDGHGGPMASRFVRDNLQRTLTNALDGFIALDDQAVWQALKMACVRLNRDFKAQHGEIANRQGTTATVAMIFNDKLWTANVGDARTVLDNNGTAVQLSHDAKPSDPRYRRGIENRGGFVQNVQGVPRVNGVLAVARAVGDNRLNGAVSARPKITMMPLSQIQAGSHLILCCDGIYDVSRTVDVVGAVHANRNLSPGVLARNIIHSAFASGSTDNLSAMVIKVR